MSLRLGQEPGGDDDGVARPLEVGDRAWVSRRSIPLEEKDGESGLGLEVAEQLALGVVGRDQQRVGRGQLSSLYRPGSEHGDAVDRLRLALLDD